MIKYRLNKEKIEKAMSEQFLTHAELARKLKWSRSLLAWALTKGSKSFAPKIAKVLGLDVSEIIVVQNQQGRGGRENEEKSKNCHSEYRWRIGQVASDH